MTSIFVAKLDYGVTQDELRSAFEVYGKVNRVSIPLDKETGKSKGFAFVEMFESHEAAEAIKALDGSTMRGRQIAVKQAEDRSNNRPAPQHAGSNQSGGYQRQQEFRPREDRSHSSSAGSNNHKDGDQERNADSRGDFNASPPLTPFKNDNRKKEKKKERPKDGADGRARPQKMEAYKKSGKNNRFFPDEDDDF